MTPTPSTNIIDGPGTELQETTIELIKMHRQVTQAIDQGVDDETSEALNSLARDLEGAIGKSRPTTIGGARALLQFTIDDIKLYDSCENQIHMVWLEAILLGLNSLCAEPEAGPAQILRPQFGEGDDDGWPCRIEAAH